MLGLVTENGNIVFLSTDVAGFTYETVQGLVGGTFEMIPHKDPMNTTLTCYVNECGVMARMKKNNVGTDMLRALNFDIDTQTVLRGTFVFCSVNIETGEDGPLTEADKTLLQPYEVKHN